MKRIVCIGANAISVAEKSSAMPPTTAPCRRDSDQNHSRTYYKANAMEEAMATPVQLPLFDDRFAMFGAASGQSEWLHGV